MWRLLALLAVAVLSACGGARVSDSPVEFPPVQDSDPPVGAQASVNESMSTDTRDADVASASSPSTTSVEPTEPTIYRPVVVWEGHTVVVDFPAPADRGASSDKAESVMRFAVVQLEGERDLYLRADAADVVPLGGSRSWIVAIDDRPRGQYGATAGAEFGLRLDSDEVEAGFTVRIWSEDSDGSPIGTPVEFEMRPSHGQ